MYLNKAFLIGNLVRDPELRSLPNGTKVANFSIATNRVWKDQQGARQESTDYHNVVVFGRQAETVSSYMKKGSSIYVEGRMQTRSWDQDGQKKYKTEVVADRIQFGSKGGGAPSSGSPASSSKGSSGNTMDEGPMDSIEYPDEDINPEDIPF